METTMTYIEPEINNEMLVRYSFIGPKDVPVTGSKDDYSSILTKLIHETGRFCLHYASDLFLWWNAFIKYIGKPIEELPEQTCFIFGIREMGVDSAREVAQNLAKGMYHYYRAIYAVDVKKEGESLLLTLNQVDNVAFPGE